MRRLAALILLLAWIGAAVPLMSNSKLPRCCRSTSCSMMKHRSTLSTCHPGEGSAAVGSVVERVRLVERTEAIAPAVRSRAFAAIAPRTIIRPLDVAIPPPRAAA